MSLFGRSYRDGERLDLEGVSVRLRVSARARRVSLRIDRASGEAVATAPDRSSLAAAARFARDRRAWLLAHLEEVPPPAPLLTAGERMAVLGEIWRLSPDGRRPRLAEPDIQGERLLAGCGEREVDPMLVARTVKREAREAFEARCAAHCEALNVELPRISLIDARTRWGSCTPPHRGRSGSIRLSWRLALAPFEVADYVVAHECAHLIEANHGPRFWALVARLVGDPAPHRRWLRAQGPALHARL
ncbi:MAG TPA: M48 family metallopeptidase [Caulobacteraceae bacterium]|jgi:hypothetical protein|nr:M48 family metallopeptidase [Caulobacteraceae bacterium]